LTVSAVKAVHLTNGLKTGKRYAEKLTKAVMIAILHPRRAMKFPPDIEKDEGKTFVFFVFYPMDAME
jgi:hypothetical protein